MSLRRNAVAAVEITALAAGAGPPANRIATRRKLCGIRGGRAIVEACCSDIAGAPLIAQLLPRRLTQNVDDRRHRVCQPPSSRHFTRNGG